MTNESRIEYRCHNASGCLGNDPAINPQREKRSLATGLASNYGVVVHRELILMCQINTTVKLKKIQEILLLSLTIQGRGPIQHDLDSCMMQSTLIEPFLFLIILLRVAVLEICKFVLIATVSLITQLILMLRKCSSSSGRDFV